MRRIDSDDRKVDKNGAGRDGFGTAIEVPPAGTHLTPAFLNETQEAICRAIELAGLTLTDDDHEQLYDAMVAVSESRTLQDGMAAYGGDGTVNQGANDLEFRGSGALRLAAGKSLKLENIGETFEVSFGAPAATENYNVLLPADAPANNEVARSAVGGQQSWIVLDSGTYTPTITDTANVTASAIRGDAHYQRIGDQVHVTVTGTATINDSAVARIDLSLPYTPSFTTPDEVSGTMFFSPVDAPGDTEVHNMRLSSTGSDLVRIQAEQTDTSSRDFEWGASFSYTVS